MEFLVLGVPWLGSLCQKGTPKNRLLDTPVCIITFYNIQPKNMNRNIHIPRLHLPTAHLRNRPEVSRLRPEANSADHRRITAHSIITRPHFSPRLPFSVSAGSRRSRFIQQSAVRPGPAQYARPPYATGRLGADSPNNRNAIVAPRGGRETFILDRVYLLSAFLPLSSFSTPLLLVIPSPVFSGHSSLPPSPQKKLLRACGRWKQVAG